jgi:large subunit ribosomal protein L12e
VFCLHFSETCIVEPIDSSAQSPKKVGDDIQKGTMDWKGLRVTVKLTIVNR